MVVLHLGAARQVGHFVHSNPKFWSGSLSEKSAHKWESSQWSPLSPWWEGALSGGHGWLRAGGKRSSGDSYLWYGVWDLSRCSPEPNDLCKRHLGQTKFWKWHLGRQRQLESQKDPIGDFFGTAFEAGQEVLKTLAKAAMFTSSESLGERAKVQGGDTWNADTVQPHMDAICQCWLSLPSFTRASCIFATFSYSVASPVDVWSFWII